MLGAIDRHLVPLGMKIATGKPYVEHKEFSNEARVRQSGGYFIWIMLPADLAGRGAELAAKALQEYDLKFAYGDMMQVFADPASAMRASKGYGNGIRLSWAWHTAEEIVEGVQRLAALVKDARNDAQS